MFSPYDRKDKAAKQSVDDVRRVMDAAEILRVREIDFFRLAWHSWHGVCGDDRIIERAFVQYMFNKTVPPWVRHFARDVLAEARRGRLQPQPHGVIRRRPEPPVPWPGAVYVSIVLAVTVLFIVVLAATPGQGDQAMSLYCDGGEGMRHYLRFAFAAAGTAPPDCP